MAEENRVPNTISAKEIALIVYQHMDGGCGCPSREYQNAFAAVNAVLKLIGVPIING
jgi:hypothetical protein